MKTVAPHPLCRLLSFSCVLSLALSVLAQNPTDKTPKPKTRTDSRSEVRYDDPKNPYLSITNWVKFHEAGQQLDREVNEIFQRRKALKQDNAEGFRQIDEELRAHNEKVRFYNTTIAHRSAERDKQLGIVRPAAKPVQIDPNQLAQPSRPSGKDTSDNQIMIPAKLGDPSNPYRTWKRADFEVELPKLEVERAELGKRRQSIKPDDTVARAAYIKDVRAFNIKITYFNVTWQSHRQRDNFK